ncbi:Protein-lysine N-methyltransferase efm4 [Sporothrix epigloea]|uniref:Protein-lysine N-methyltransferase efm4 n=1 Tax=Sporothrix epigloea TaxID=1892477 RepID=A0ABP0D9R9_9PEZI
MASLTVTKVPRQGPTTPPSHWVNSPPTHFRNPWPSYRQSGSLTSILSVRFGRGRKFVPVPANREGLVPIQTPDWGDGAKPQQIKATWIGHSSFLMEMPSTHDGAASKSRGLRFLMDPVFCERMGPAQIVGPKRFSPTPCTMEELPLVDALCISHNHYDHLDIDTVTQLYADKARRRPAAGLAPLQIFCGLGSKQWFVRNCGVEPDHVTEMDWWDEVDVAMAGSQAVRLVCTPSQHNSRRSGYDGDQMLWCSFVLTSRGELGGSVFFAGDTGYRSVLAEDIAAKIPINDLPHCRAFAEIGARYGPMSLALLPIGCYSPRTFIQLSVGMHYGTVRGGISAHYEDVREPPMLWRSEGEARGLVWDRDIRLCNIGETVIV